jgi:two-component system cell cycle sensor histidine kinase/response regulator CckA
MAGREEKTTARDRREQAFLYEQRRFQSIFRYSAVSLWEEDISELRAELAKLASRGIVDLRRYIAEHPEFLAEAARTIKVVDVNDATLALYEVRDRSQLLGPLSTTLDLTDPVMAAGLTADILLIAEGARYAERESRAVTPSGKRLEVEIKMSIPDESDPYHCMLVNVVDITDRKRADEELHHSRQLLQVVLDHIPQRVFWKDRNLRYLGCNAHFAEDAGLREPEGIAGMDDFQMAWRETAEMYRRDDTAVIETGTPKLNYEEPQTRSDGSLQWLRTSKVPLRDRDGMVFGVLGTYEDITEHQKAEEALRESERHYRELFAAAQRQAQEMELLNQVRTALARELELPVVFRAVVEGIARTFGYTQVSLFLLRGETLVCEHQVGYENIIAEIPISRGISGRVARTGTPLLLADVRSDPEFLGAMDGIVSELCIPLFDQGRVVGTLNVESMNGVVMGEADLHLMTALGEHVNIAIAKARLYAEARESEERYRTLVENLGEGVAIVDPTEHFLFANPAAEAIFGVPPGGLGGRGLEDFLSKEEYTRVLTETERRARGERTTYEEDIIRPDGTMRRIELTATPQFDESGAFAGTFGVLRDITETRRTEEALRHSEERLAQAQKMEAVGRLAGGIAHDFNNLLTVIRGYADLMEEGMAEAHPMKADLKEIKQAADRAAGLTRQLLAFSRKQVLRVSILNLNEVVRGMEKMLPRILGEDIRLVTVLAPDLPTTRADQGQLDQVIMNLAANARDAMPHGGVLTLSTGRRVVGEGSDREHPEILPGEYITLEVSDTGAGIDREVLPRIFEPFFTTKAVGKGTGLGLATVYGIIKQSEGYIYCASEPGSGTTFTIYLPRSRGESIEAKKPARESGSLKGNETILVVEDEDAILGLILSILGRSGYKATGARNGGQALAAAASRTGPIHLLLTDVVMPQMSGPDLGRKLKEVLPDVRVLYMSGFTDHPAVQQGVRDSLVDMIRKPFTADALLRKIRDVLDGEGMPQ